MDYNIDVIKVKLLRRAIGDYTGNLLNQGYILVEELQKTTRHWLAVKDISNIMENQHKLKAEDGYTSIIQTDVFFLAGIFGYTVVNADIMKFFLEMKMAKGMTLEELEKGA